MVAWPLEKEMQFVDAVLDRYQGQVVTLTFGAVSASKFDSAALERLEADASECDSCRCNDPSSGRLCPVGWED